jgi:hypothetical protein
VGGHRLPPPDLQDAGELREPEAEVDAAALQGSGAPREAEVDAADGHFYVGCEWIEKSDSTRSGTATSAIVAKLRMPFATPRQMDHRCS